MKYLKLFESFENINEICKQYGIKNYTINTDGTIDVNDDVWICNTTKSSHNKTPYILKKLPLKFNKVIGDFSCHNNGLTTLEGSPKEIIGEFYCANNELTSFKYSPSVIHKNSSSYVGVFDCRNNNIKSFEYFPTRASLFNFYCDGNPIYNVWMLFQDKYKIELLNDFDIFRDEDTDEPAIFIERLNEFLETIELSPVKYVNGYKNI